MALYLTLWKEARSRSLVLAWRTVMNQLARRFTWKCWSMAWKQELCFLQYLPNIPAYLPLPRYFQRYSQSSTLPPRVSAVVEHSIILQISGEWHHMSDFGCWKPLEIERLVLRRSLFHIFSSSLKSGCTSYLHLTPYPSKTHTVTQRDFGSRKEKASKTLHWALKHAKIYQALRMETCQGEAFLGKRKADLPNRAILQGPTPIPLNKAWTRRCQSQ